MLRTLMAAAVVTTLAGPALAQSNWTERRPGPPPSFNTDYDFEHRYERQRISIERRRHDGALTAREAMGIERDRQAALRLYQRFRADGRLTRQERAALDARMDRVDRRIWRESNDRQRSDAGGWRR